MCCVQLSFIDNDLVFGYYYLINGVYFIVKH